MLVMALPSSPPLLPEVDPPTSPLTLPEEAELPIGLSELPIARPSRKRALSDYASLSSDPIFSEGTSDGDEEVVEGQPRRKRLVRGPWWNLRRASGPSFRRRMAKRERLRNADSGVWLGSDMSDDTIDSLHSSQQRMADLDVEDYGTPSAAPRPHAPRRLPTANELAAKAIYHALDTGHESVDLSGLGLAELPDATLKPLHQLIRPSHTDLTQPPSEDEFTPLTPSIKLFLSGNQLTSLPSELFRLTNIAVLSLRNNELSDIPPCIGRLSNLTELNVAQNTIKCLPSEMLDLMHCRGAHRQIIVRPNPLVDPIDEFRGPSPLSGKFKASPEEFNEHLSRWGETDGAFFQQMKHWYSEADEPWSMRHELELRLKLGRLRRMKYVEGESRAGRKLELCKEELVYLASSAVRFFDVDGSACRTATISGIGNEDQRLVAVVDPLADAPASSKTSNAPALFELALRAAQSTFNLHDLNDLPDDTPQTVTAALQQAAKGAEYGNESCSVCSEPFVIARAEWIEYWFNGYPSQQHLTPETTLPFLRRVCSWRCARPHELGAFRF